MRLFIGAMLLALLLITLSEAATLTFSWTAVTTYEDGTPCTITGYSLYCGSSSGGESGTPVYTGTALTSAVTGTQGVDIYCRATATASNGQVSAYSSELKKTFPLARPSPPVLQ